MTRRALVLCAAILGGVILTPRPASAWWETTFTTNHIERGNEGLIMARIGVNTLDTFGWELGDSRIVQGPVLCPQGAPITYTFGTSQTYGGITWVMSSAAQIGHFGYMYMTNGVTYTFYGLYDDSFALYIDDVVILKWYNDWTSYYTGTYTPSFTGWHAIKIYCGQVTGEFGGTANGPRWSIDGGTTYNQFVIGSAELSDECEHDVITTNRVYRANPPASAYDALSPWNAPERTRIGGDDRTLRPSAIIKEN